MDDAVQLGVFGSDEDCNLTLGARRTNWKDTGPIKDQNELECARRFCRDIHPTLTNLEKQPQYSGVDVLAETPDKPSCLKLQITTIWPEDFWTPLGTTGAVDKQISRQELADLMREAITQKKEKYGRDFGDVTLLLDTHPGGIESRCLNKLKADEVLLRKIAGDNPMFAEIWLVDLNGSVRIS